MPLEQNDIWQLKIALFDDKFSGSRIKFQNKKKLKKANKSTANIYQEQQRIDNKE